jgi:hypothetical protein
MIAAGQILRVSFICPPAAKRHTLANTAEHVRVLTAHGTCDWDFPQ